MRESACYEFSGNYVLFVLAAQTFTGWATQLLLPAHFVDFARFEEASPRPGLAGIEAGP